jgi:Tfp pilus assembly PilM family ATPase
MAKAPTSVIGLDLGRYSLKAVLLQQRKGGSYALTHYGSHVPETPPTDSASLGKQIKAVLRDLGGSAKHCVVSVSSPDALIRIIEQPETPPHILRDALRLNGMSLLNQDVKSFVLDCDFIAPVASEGEGGAPRMRYLVGGLPRTEVQNVADALRQASLTPGGMQLAPVCIFNAFEVAHPEKFNNEAFFLVDVGHATSTVVAGVKREMVLVRSIDFGGKALLEALAGLSGEGPSSVFDALEMEDEVMVEYTRVAINSLTREIGSSIGFFEARHEETIASVYVTGGPAKSKTFLKLMREELGIPCEPWCALDACENQLPPARRQDYERESLDLNVACGAAAEAFKTA